MMHDTSHLTSMPSVVMNTESLSIGYRSNQGRRIVASSLNLHLQAGEFVCLLGPNGAGKSTLIRTLAGIQAPLAGSVHITQQDVATLDKKTLARYISLVLTDRITSGNFSVYTLLTLGRYPYLNWFGALRDSDEALIEQAIRLAGIEAFIDKTLFDLSDGERQKVMIARALVQDTPLIILDEPTAHLDLPNRIAIMQLLRNLVRQTGKAVVMSTHELELALQTADRIWMMMPGEPLASGAAEDLILDGTFERAFRKNGFDFCRETGSFKVRGTTRRQRISVGGDRVAQFWTRRALEREGYEVVEAATLHVEIQAQNAETLCWSLLASSRAVKRCSNIQQLLAELQRVEE